MKKAIDLREMTDAELNLEYEECTRELFNLRIQSTLGQLENPSKIKELRRDIARINTVKTERAKQSDQHKENEVNAS